MAADCPAQLRALLAQLDGARGIDEAGRLFKDLLKIGRRWPEEASDEESKAIERLSNQLMKFADSQQQDIVAAFRPLREDVRQRMADATAALNSWLSEAPHPERASPQRLAEVLQAIDDAPQMRWYKQCTDLGVKAHFLVAMASIARAVSSSTTPLRSRASGYSQATALLQRLTERFFVIPEHGNVLDTWHNGRLEFYNTTLWRAAKRAADRLKDDLQVRLVSALRRATASTQPVVTGGKAKPQLQLELHQWPMVNCPLARAFLDFVAQRGPELGDLGQPVLSECPPHSLLPSTLRKLLGRLDAFEILDDEGAPANSATGPEKLGCERLGVVRLRWEAVAALAFKAVGTKPKASSLAGPPSTSQGGRAEAGGVGSRGPRSAGPSQARSSAERQDGADGESDGASASASQKPVQRRIDWSNAIALERLVRRGLRVGDEEWRQSWHHFCKQRRVPPDEAGLVESAPPREVLAEFLERNLQTLLKKEWAKDLMYRAGTDSDREMVGAAGSAARRRRDEESSSSASESSRSKQQRKRRKREKRRGGMMGYGDYFHRPEVMMMNMNRMGMMSMMLNNNLAMMGMGNPLMQHQMSMMPSSTAVKMKKDDRGKRDRPDDKGRKAMIDADDL